MKRPRFQKASRTRLMVCLTSALLILVGAPQLKADSTVLNAIFLQIAFFNEDHAFSKGTPTNNSDGSQSIGALVLMPRFIFDPGAVGSTPPIGNAAANNSVPLFGTTSVGGIEGEGTVFTMNSDGTGYTLLHIFTNLDGQFPAAGLVPSDDGVLFGTTVNGGASGNGTVFSVQTNGTGFKVLHSFSARNNSAFTNSDGASPYGQLILSGDTLYGTAANGGNANEGTVFSIETNGMNFTVLHDFTAAKNDPNFNLTNSDGATPYAKLLLSGTTLYGTASGGGIGGAGTVFAVDTNGANFKVLHSFAAMDPLRFTNADGVAPEAGVILSGDTLYGTTFQGGGANRGTVFAVNTNGTIFTNLYIFTGGSDGGKPAADLILFSNVLFGTSTGFGNSGSGTVFGLTTNGTVFRVIHSFDVANYDGGFSYTNTDGANPKAGLIAVSNVLYGTTSGGGSGGNGTVFNISFLPRPSILSLTLSRTNLVINGANGLSNGTYVTLISPDFTQPLSTWTPAATNFVPEAGNFTFTATNVVDPQASRRFFILRSQ